MATLHEVAQRVGASPSTVSRALSRPEMVASETREKILKVVKELGYEPNQIARGLRQKQSRIVGFIVSDVANPFNGEIVRGLQRAAYERHYNLILCCTDEDAERERAYIRLLRSYQLQGLIILPGAHTKGALEPVTDIPIVEVDSLSGHLGTHAVLVDNVRGAREATDHLIALGHRRIGAIAGRQRLTTGTERLEGYRAAMRAARLTPRREWVVTEKQVEADGYAAACTLLDLPPLRRPTALFGYNNETTAGALRAVRERQLRVPGDLSVVGFDDTRWAQLLEPPLTVVAQPAYEIGYLAAERLFRVLEGGKLESEPLRLEPHLIVRASTAPPPVAVA